MSHTPNMPTRRIGKSNIEVSPIGCGCMGLSEFYGPVAEDERRHVLRRALDLGVTHFDTADMYGAGDNEVLVGRELHDVRSRVIIATKFGIVRSDGIRTLDGSAAYVRQACEASLRRLKTDVIDILYLHRLDPNVPIEETVGAMARLVAEGKVRALGLSKIDVATLIRAEAVHPIAAVQMKYSLWTRDVEDQLLEECRRRDVALIAYSPLGKGLLAGRVNPADSFPVGDWRRTDLAFAPEALAAKAALLRVLERVARDERCTLAQLGLAWLLSRGPGVLPIPGMRSIAQVEENVAAAGVRLSAEALAAAEACVPQLASPLNLH